MKSIVALVFMIWSVLCQDEDYRNHEWKIDLGDCPCEDKLLCQSLPSRSSENPLKKEVFAFILHCPKEVWLQFNWKKLTTIALVGFHDSELVCYAHSHGVRAVKVVNIDQESLLNGTARHYWIKQQLSDVIIKFMDGINIDYEDEVENGSLKQFALTSLAQETTTLFHSYLPASQISFDVAWAPSGIDRRFYDYKAIASAVDAVFIMAYDEQSQIWSGPCNARANSDLFRTAFGLKGYLELGIPSSKVILGVPWYGYNYQCLSLVKDVCYIKRTPFRGSNCSDAAGTEIPLSYIRQVLKESTMKEEWDPESLTPWFNVKNSTSGTTHQFRYDNIRSLAYKYALALAYDLRGIGMWTANFLDYTGSDTVFTQYMWTLLL